MVATFNTSPKLSKRNTALQALTVPLQDRRVCASKKFLTYFRHRGNYVFRYSHEYSQAHNTKYIFAYI